MSINLPLLQQMLKYDLYADDVQFYIFSPDSFLEIQMHESSYLLNFFSV